MPVYDVRNPGIGIPVEGLPGFYDRTTQTIDTDALVSTHNAILLDDLKLRTILPDAPAPGTGIVGTYQPLLDPLFYEARSIGNVDWTVDAGWTVDVDDVQWYGTLYTIDASPTYVASFDIAAVPDSELEIVFRRKINTTAGQFRILMNNVEVNSWDMSVSGATRIKYRFSVPSQDPVNIKLETTPDGGNPADAAVIIDYVRLYDVSGRILPPTAALTASYQALLVTRNGNWLDETLIEGQMLVAKFPNPDPTIRSDWYIAPQMGIDYVLKRGNETTKDLLFKFNTQGVTLESNDGTRRFLYIDDTPELQIARRFTETDGNVNTFGN